MATPVSTVNSSPNFSMCSETLNSGVDVSLQTPIREEKKEPAILTQLFKILTVSENTAIACFQSVSRQIVDGGILHLGFCFAD